MSGVNYYLCAGRGSGIIDPENWTPIDLLYGVDVMDVTSLPEAERVFATPPCGSFTDLPWRPATNADRPILEHCLRLCLESGAPWILENNRWAQKFIGPAVCHRGGHYFWGEVGLLPMFKSHKASKSGKDPLERAHLPAFLAAHPPKEKGTKTGCGHSDYSQCREAGCYDGDPREP